MTFWETFWATFAGGIAASLVALIGVVIVEYVRNGQEEARLRAQREKDERDRREAERSRRRHSRNAAQTVLLELTAAAWPLERVVAKLEAFEPLRVERRAWDDPGTKQVLADAMDFEALRQVDRAYDELEAIRDKMLPQQRGSVVVRSEFYYRLMEDEWKLADRLLEVHVRPGVRRLEETIEGLGLAGEQTLSR